MATLAQEHNSQGTFYWDQNKNHKLKIADKITLEAHRAAFLLNDSVIFLRNKYFSKKYDVNADIFVQRLCNFGNPSDNIYGFDNFNFTISVISDKKHEIKQKVLDQISLIFSDNPARHENTWFDENLIYPYEIQISADSSDITNPIILITPSSNWYPGTSDSLYSMYFYYSDNLIIVHPGKNKDFASGNLNSFLENFNPDRHGTERKGWYWITDSQFPSYYKTYFLSK